MLARSEQSCTHAGGCLVSWYGFAPISRPSGPSSVPGGMHAALDATAASGVCVHSPCVHRRLRQPHWGTFHCREPANEEQPPTHATSMDQSPAAALQVAGEGDRALAQLAGLVRLVAGASLQGPAAVVALKAARTVVADRPSLVGRLAPALLAVASRLAPGAAAGLTGSLGWLPCWLCGRTCVCC